MASPVQIVLNPENFSENRDTPSGGGPRTDFFLNNDAGFKAHRRALVEQLRSIISDIERQSATFGAVAFVKVILRRKAWAKSHRPVKALFPHSRTPLVGGLDLGQMVVEVTPSILARAAQEIQQAEDTIRWKVDEETEKKTPIPSIRRSEVGAIEKIELYGPADRRHFDLDQAVAWLSNARTGGQYEVELFETPPPPNNLDAAGPRRQLFQSFVQGLQALGSGISVNALPRRARGEAPQLAVRLERTALPARVQLTPEPQARARALAPFDPSRERHSRLIGFLERHPLVRRIDLPGVVMRSAPTLRTRPGSVALPERQTSRSWPRVGVIDGGISDAALGDWVVGRWALLADEDVDQSHGTFIGGILVAGSEMNGADVCSDGDGTELFDIAVHPATDQAFATYYGDLNGFLNEVENAVVEARTRHQVRVFNFSLNVQTAVAPDYYSKVAARLDQIADAHDVIIVISAGNLSSPRPEWPAQADSALQMMAASQNDGILIPAESARNVSVGALNPMGMPAPVLGLAPARYSRRGPGLRALVKPDFVHVGGSGAAHGNVGHGLFSLNPDGSIADSCGTSFATPFIARQAAMLDAQIEGPVSRETLVALLAHHARVPEPLNEEKLSVVGRQLCGHGMPASVEQILEADDHQITLVFASRLYADKQLRFPFAWPSCLADNGKCRGNARLTLVASPPLDQRFGAEFVRVNVEAALQQEHLSRAGKATWKGQLKPWYLPASNQEHPFEAERVEHGMKWSPVKVCGDLMPQGRGNSSNWRLIVSYLSRSDNQEMPAEGVPFTVLLTISDPKKEEPVFNVMRQQLSMSVQLADIRTAARVLARV